MAKQQDADVAFIEALARLLREHDLTEIDVDREEGEESNLKVRLTRQFVQAPAAPAPVAAAPAMLPSPATPSSPPSAPEDPAEHPGAVTAPMVGTIYLSPEPGASSFINVGDQVKEGQVLLIVEAMKTMNQIPSPFSGVVKRIMVENGQAVEFGAPLVIIE